MVRNVNDGSSAAPRLASFLNMGSMGHLPDWSTAPRGEERAVLEAVKAAGFEGVQGGDHVIAAELGLLFAHGGRVNEPADADRIAKESSDRGAVAATVHVGWGLEDDEEVDRLVDAVINASQKVDMPICIETHRATITQDLWRSVQIVQRRPDVRFNGDFSHWYTGLEMVYGSFEDKVAFAGPVMDRVRFMHGRIGNSGCMQVGLPEDLAEAKKTRHVEHFMVMWRRAMAGFLASAEPGDVLPFAPELLWPAINYARTFPVDGEQREESDRWTQSLLLADIARECFRDAAAAAG